MRRKVRRPLTVWDGTPQMEKRLAQVLERRRLREIRPQQADQPAAPVAAMRLDGQVGQQRPHLVVAEPGDRLTIQVSRKGPEQRE